MDGWNPIQFEWSKNSKQWPQKTKTQNHTERNVWQLRVVWGSEIRFFIVLSEENCWLPLEQGVSFGDFFIYFLYSSYNLFGWACLLAWLLAAGFTSIVFFWCSNKTMKTMAIVRNGGGNVTFRQFMTISYFMKTC